MDAGIAAVEVWGAKKALDAAQKMKGDESAVIAVADEWRRAADSLTSTEQFLSKSWNDLTADWQGGAYEAFRWHMTRNATVASTNAEALAAAGEALLDLSLQVANAYNMAVDLTTLAAGRIEPALGGIRFMSNKKTDKPTITNALLDYVEAINKVDTNLRMAVDSQKVGLAKFASALVKLNTPGTFPANATNPKRWTPR
ncbi:hypothetical protein ACQPZ8_09420 [Actinomadura nitritigenes]|uniref:hypothetical protein n=1 Tax=Actinomadura nitritigenes TaxID=134602 RepID=UPI0036958CCE